MKITTTTKKFREGVKLSGKKGDEVRWESTGHLSVRLLDASGSFPLVARSVSVDIPGEGRVSLETDVDGAVFHPDVPFQDYELDLGATGKAWVPAVAARIEQHIVPVSSAAFGWIDLHFVDEQGIPLAAGIVTILGERFDLERADAPGCIRVQTPHPDNAASPEITFDGEKVDIRLPTIPSATIVRIAKDRS